LSLVFLTTPAWANTYTVTNTNDSGAGSLRQARLDANANAGLENITFNIPGGGPHTIAPLTALPNITSPVLLDGYTQPGASANTLAIGSDAVIQIQIDGVNLPNFVHGLFLTTGSDGSTIRGLAIYRVSGGGVDNGIYIENSTGNFITGNYLGTDATGAAAGLGNERGIEVRSNNNTIGGATPQDRNVVSGNLSRNIFINGGSSNQVLGNYVGLQPNGNSTVGIGSTLYGVWLTDGAQSNTVGGTTSGSRNVISGIGQFGILIDNANTTANVVIGNYIGTDATGTLDRGNNTWCKAIISAPTSPAPPILAIMASVFLLEAVATTTRLAALLPAPPTALLLTAIMA